MTWTDLGEIVPTNFKKITIESSNYNPDIDSDITITITVKDQNDEGVANWTVPLKIDGTSISNIVTSENGVVNYTYTCSTWGLHTFHVNESNIQIKVGGWKTHRDDSAYTLKYNQDIVQLELHIADSSVSTSWVQFGANVIPDSNPDLRPAASLVGICTDKRINFRVLSSAQTIGFVSTTAVSGVGLYGAAIWKRK